MVPDNEYVVHVSEPYRWFGRKWFDYFLLKILHKEVGYARWNENKPRKYLFWLIIRRSGGKLNQIGYHTYAHKTGTY